MRRRLPLPRCFGHFHGRFSIPERDLKVGGFVGGDEGSCSQLIQVTIASLEVKAEISVLCLNDLGTSCQFWGEKNIVF